MERREGSLSAAVMLGVTRYLPFQAISGYGGYGE